MCARAQVVLGGRGDTAYSAEWDAQEQAGLDAALGRYPVNTHSPLERYVRAAAALPKKCAHGVPVQEPRLPAETHKLTNMVMQPFWCPSCITQEGSHTQPPRAEGSPRPSATCVRPPRCPGSAWLTGVNRRMAAVRPPLATFAV